MCGQKSGLFASHDLGAGARDDLRPRCDQGICGAQFHSAKFWYAHAAKRAEHRRVTACMTPKWDLDDPKLWPAFLQFLEYHFLVGVDRFFIYDIDGRSSRLARAYASHGGRVTYFPFWCRELSGGKGAKLCSGDWELRQAPGQAGLNSRI